MSQCRIFLSKFDEAHTTADMRNIHLNRREIYKEKDQIAQSIINTKKNNSNFSIKKWAVLVHHSATN